MSSSPHRLQASLAFFPPLLALFAATVAVAQEPADASRIDPGERFFHDLVPIHTAPPDQGVDYGVWAAGSGYKASFHDGACFVPVLGPSYPHNLPWSWRTTSVRIGDDELVTQAPRLTWSGLHAEYDLGGVVEAYDVREQGLEQTFVLASRPVGQGDLVVSGDVATALQAANVDAAHRELVFCGSRGEQLVRYGTATAIDADGNTRPMTTGFVDGRVSLRLDADWLQHARFPVVIDPLLGPGNSIGGVNPRAEIDVVREENTALSAAVWIAYTVVVSASDQDLTVRRWNDDGTTSVAAYQDVTASWSTADPHCAWVGVTGHVVISFDRWFPTTQRRFVRFHRHDRNDLTVTTDFGIVNSADNAWHSDVSGVLLPSFLTPEALVVWQQEPNGGGPFQETGASAIYGCYLDVAAGTAGAPFAIADSPINDNERPSLPGSTPGGMFGWVLACQNFNTFGLNDDWDVHLRQVGLDGTIGPVRLVDSASPDHKMAPRIEGQAPDLMVAFTSSTLAQQPGKPAGINGHQIRTVAYDWDVVNQNGVAFPTVVLQSNNDPRLELGGLGFDSVTQSHWLLTFRSNVSNVLFARTVGFSGNQLHAETVVDPPGSDVSLRGGVGFDPNGHRFILAYGVNSATSYVTTDRFVFPAVTPWSVSGSHCSAADIGWYGSQLIGDGDVRVNITNAPSGSLHVLAMASDVAAVQLIGVPPFVSGCWLLIQTSGPDYLGLVGAGFGQAPVWNLRLPEFLVSDTFYFQDIHTDGSASLNLLTTERLTVPVVK